MLIWFAVENWKCFRDRQELSMETVGQVEDEFAFDTEAKLYSRLNRVATIYGPNGSGKSCLIEALAFMKHLVVHSAGGQIGEPIDVKPFLFDAQTREKPTRFEIGFIREGSTYEYGFSADINRVWEEWLHVRPPDGRLQRWLDREFDPSSKEYEWKFSPSLRGSREMWRKATRANALYASTAAQLNSESLSPVIEWFSDLQTAGPKGFWANPTSERLRSEPHFRSRIMNFLRNADIPVTDIRIREENLRPDGPHSKKVEETKYLPEWHKVIQIKDTRVPEFGLPVAGTNELAYLPLEEQSDGTQRMFEFAIPWFDAIDQGMVVVADELDCSLHPRLVQFLVGLINRTGGEVGQRAQLVATVHDATLLQEVLDRNQVWLTDRHSDQSASITALSDYRPRPNESLFRGYLGGRYNAVPTVADPETID